MTLSHRSRQLYYVVADDRIMELQLLLMAG